MEAVNVFHACETQWNFAGHGVRVGLNYVAVESVMRIRGVEDTKATLRKIQIMEREVLSIDYAKANDD